MHEVERLISTVLRDVHNWIKDERMILSVHVILSVPTMLVQKFSPDTKLHELALQRDKLGIDGIVLFYNEWNSKRALLEKDIRRLSDFYLNREI